MSNIKIFVSHRIDQENIMLENPIYTPVRCGAYFDTNPAPTMLGDDTGENISEKREFLGELTVQYWAWKNVEADYYGLCHYRRYLSFSEKKYPTDEKNQVIEGRLNEHSFEKYKLNDVQHIEEMISGYDAVVAEYADISGMFTPRGPKPTIYEHFSAYDGYLVDKEDIELFLNTLESLYPEYGESAREYFAGKNFRGYNCFILRKPLFFKLCKIQTHVVQTIYKQGKIDFRYRSSLQSRTYGFFCEWMYGIFIYHLEKTKKAKIKYTQLIFFNKTEQAPFIQPLANHIPIVFITNRYLLPVTQVAIQSLLLKKKSSTRYDIIVCHEELPDEDVELTVQHFKQYEGLLIRFINFRELSPEASNGMIWNKTDNPTHATYLLPWILKKFDRIIYLHSDILAMTDLSELITTDLSNFYLAAALDYFRLSENKYDRNIEKMRRHKLGMEDPYQFFSTSVLVMDLASMRKNIMLDTCIRYALGSYICRDVMNKLFSGKVKILNTKWNVCSKANDSIKMLEGFMPDIYMKDNKKAQKNPAILHYPFYPKPWQSTENEWSSVFWKIARDVPLYEKLIVYLCYPATSLHQINHPLVRNKASFLHRLSNVLLPIGSLRRKLVKKVVPRGSKQWFFFKHIYYFLFKD